MLVPSSNNTSMWPTSNTCNTCQNICTYASNVQTIKTGFPVVYEHKQSKYVPASITAWILSLGPSVRYDRAQQASDNTSRSEWWTNSDSAGRHWHTALNGGGGFLLRQRFDSVHVTLRRNGTEVSALMWDRSGSRHPLVSTWSRRSGPSPVTDMTQSLHTLSHLYTQVSRYTTRQY